MKPDSIEFASGGVELLPEYLPLWTAAFGDTEEEARAVLSASGAERDIFLLRHNGEAAAGACAMGATMTGAARTAGVAAGAGAGRISARASGAAAEDTGAATGGAGLSAERGGIKPVRGSYLYAMTVREDMRGHGLFRAFCENILTQLEARGDAFAALVPARPELFSMYRALGFDREAAGLLPMFGAPPLVLSQDEYASLPLSPFDGDTARLAALAEADECVSRVMLDGGAFTAAAEGCTVSYLRDGDGIYGYVVAENSEYSVNIYDFSFLSGRGGYIISRMDEVRNLHAIRPKALWRDFTGALAGGRELFADILFEG